MRKRSLVLIFIFGVFAHLSAQIAPSRYLVKFTDKEASPYSIASPQAFLSQRALDRRAKFGIAVDHSDIPIDPAYIQAVVASGAKLLIQVKWLNGILVQTDSQSVLDAINALSFVTTIEPIKKKTSNFKQSDKFFVTEDSELNKSTFADPIYGDAFNQINMVNGILLHQAGYKGNGLVIAILDAGFLNVDVRTIFSALWANNQILGTYNFVDPSIKNLYTNINSHGTLVLSVMGGKLPGIFLGTAPEAKYWLLRTEDVNSEFLIEEYNWMAGAAFADSVGADIINSSLGYTEFDDSFYNHSWTDLDGNTTPVTKAADFAASKGILVVNSAGNSGDDPWKYINAPADGDSVLSVGAVYASGIITTFSSYGLEWDTRVKPNIVAQGGSTVLANEYTDAVKTANGTSFSSPLIAGMMACLWQTNPNASNIELIHAVERSSSKYLIPDYRYGYGIPDFENAKGILGISDNWNVENSIQVVPNPIYKSGLVQWNSAKTPFQWIELLDFQGKIIFRAEFSEQTSVYNLGMENYKAGIYFLRLGNSFNTVSKKIIKIN